MATQPGDRTNGQPSLSDEIRFALLRGEYGPGQRLIEGDICKRFKASRFAVRAALQELAGYGLVDFTHNRGAHVHEVSVREAIEVMEVRKELAGIVASRAAERANDETLEAFQRLRTDMQSAFESDDFAAYRVLTRDLQQLLQVSSGHTVAAQLLRQLHDRTARYGYALAMLPNGSRASLPYYEAIIDAVVARDPEKAGEAARNHLASMIDALLRWAAQFSDEHMESDQAGVVWVPELSASRDWGPADLPA